MSRQTIKIFISIILLMTISTGGKALQINSEQKFQMVEYKTVIETQENKIQELQGYQVEMDEKKTIIHEQEKVIKALNTDLTDLTTEIKALKSQNEALTEKVVYLTFDDGPSSESTAKILEVLKYYNVKATFFVQGRNVARFPEALKLIYDAGHTVGNHSYSHNYTMIYSSEDTFWEDFDKCQEMIYSVIGIYPDIYRFPGGSIEASNKSGESIVGFIGAAMIENDMQYFDWNIDTGDSAAGNISAKTIKMNAFVQLGKKKNAIVLMHDTDPKVSTIEALPEIIEHYLSMGYRFDVLTPNGFTSQFK